MRRRRRTRTKSSMAKNETTTVCVSPSSSSLQIVDAQCSLERQTARHTTSRFFVEDILRPDFSARHPTWLPNNCVRVDASLCPLSIDQQRLTCCSWSASSSPVPLTTTTSTAVSATVRDESTTTAADNDRKPLNIKTLPAWVFCTRYSDRPSSGRPRGSCQ